jgi:hypothetical protein
MLYILIGVKIVFGEAQKQGAAVLPHAYDTRRRELDTAQ